MDSLCDFLEFFNKAGKCLQIPFPKPKIESGSTKSKNNLFARYYNDIIEHSKRQILYRSDLKTTVPVFFIEKFELPGNQFILTEVVNLKHCEFHHLHKKGYYVANRCGTTECKCGM